MPRKLKNKFIQKELVTALKCNKYNIYKRGITQSLITSFMKCPRLFLYKINKLELDGYNYTTSFGNLIHYILDKIYSEKRNDIEQIIKEYEIEYESNVLIIDQTEKASAYILCQEYLEYYKEDLQWDFLGVEQELQTKLFNIPINVKYDGKYKTKDNKIYLIEHKTMSRISEDSIMKRLSFDFQSLFYTIACEKYYDETISGVLYNIIRKPSIKIKQNETVFDFYNRLRKDIKSRPEHYFIRYTIPYTDNDKKGFTAQLFSIIKQILNTLSYAQMTHIKSDVLYNNRVFYKNSSNCQSQFTCKYLDACATNKLTGYKQTDKLFPELKHF